MAPLYPVDHPVKHEINLKFELFIFFLFLFLFDILLFALTLKEGPIVFITVLILSCCGSSSIFCI